MIAPAAQKIRLIMQLRKHGVTDARVLAAIESIPREQFVPADFADQAYEDRALPIEQEQTISQPSMVGVMTQALELNDRSTLLEIGTGSGYQAAILSRLARRVYTVDRFKRLVTEAEQAFRAQNYTNITAVTADGSHGLPEQSPFDRILVTAAAEDPPGTLLAQLRIGGIMVLPVGQSDAVQRLIRVTKTETGYDYEELRTVRFVPLLEGIGQD